MATIKEHLSNFNIAMQGYLTDNGYDLDKEPEDDASFADELESAASAATDEYRDNLGEDEDAVDSEGNDLENEEPPAHKE